MSNTLKTIETIAQTPEAVAYQLMTHVLKFEGMGLFGGLAATKNPTREDILSTYAECLKAVKGQYQLSIKARVA